MCNRYLSPAAFASAHGSIVGSSSAASGADAQRLAADGWQVKTLNLQQASMDEEGMEGEEIDDEGDEQEEKAQQMHA